MGSQRLGRLQDRAWQVLNGSKIRTRTAVVLNWLLVILIFTNVIAVTLETVPSLATRFETLFWTFEVVSVVLFTFEYFVRLWCVPAGVRVLQKRLGEAIPLGAAAEAEVRELLEAEPPSRLRWALSPMALIDLVAILPSLFPALLVLDMRFLRALRLLRFFRLLKVARYTRSLNRFRQVLRDKREELLLSFFVMMICLLLASSLMYYIERGGPAGKNFDSIPAAMWWAVAALSTVGYGDVYPVTPLGRFLGAVIAMVGIGLFGLPAGILASGFMEGLDKKGTQEAPGESPSVGPASPAPPPAAGSVSCPHCGGGLALQLAIPGSPPAASGSL